MSESEMLLIVNTLKPILINEFTDHFAASTTSLNYVITCSKSNFNYLISVSDNSIVACFPSKELTHFKIIDVPW